MTRPNFSDYLSSCISLINPDILSARKHTEYWPKDGISKQELTLVFTVWYKLRKTAASLHNNRKGTLSFNGRMPDGERDFVHFVELSESKLSHELKLLKYV